MADYVSALVSLALRRYRNDARGLRRTLAEFERLHDTETRPTTKAALAEAVKQVRERLAQMDLPLDVERGP